MAKSMLSVTRGKNCCKPDHAKRRSSGRIFLSPSHTHDGSLYYITSFFISCQMVLLCLLSQHNTFSFLVK